MEFGIRDWMIIVGVLLLIAVLLDGYRRVRNERRNRIRMSLSRQIPGEGDDPLPNPELPNGGARIVGRRRGDQHADERESQGGAREEYGDEDAVPVLMEPDVPDAPGGDEDERDDPLFAEVAPEDAEPAAARGAAESPSEEPSRAEPRQLDVLRDSGPVEPEQVLVIHAVARDAGGFKGQELLQILLACDLRFGDLSIFHRYEKAGGNGPVQFSVANMVKPGSFDLDLIDDFATPGVSFFLTLPGPERPAQAFDYMVETAQCLAKNLDAELRDESHSVVTPQTLSHCRQRVRDFQRRSLAQHA